MVPSTAPRGPTWHGGTSGEPQALASCYRRCLETAAARDIKSLAFPGISTGAYGYPLELAAALAVETVLQFLKESDAIQEIVFCCHSADDLAVCERILRDGSP